MNILFRRIVAVALTLMVSVGTADAGVVRIGVASLPPQKGNPFGAVARTAWYTLRAYLDTLTQLGPDMRPEPALALTWKKTDDATWVVTLRPDVTFSNGEPFDADAVVATIAFLQSPDAVADSISQEVRNIARARALDKLTVEFKTRVPDPTFARQMTTIPVVPPVLWRKVGRDGFLLSPVGTGSFKVEKWEKNRVVLVPFKGSWRPPRADGVEILELPDQSTRIQALLSGRIDIASEIGADDVDTVKAAGFNVYQRPATSVDVMAFNALKADSPFKDARVRQAINYAVNREAISKNIFHGMVPPATQTASRTNPEYDPALKGYPYDPAKAKALLAEAGYPNGFSFVDLMSHGTTGSEIPAAMEQAANDLARIGVKMEIREVPWPQWVRGVQQTGIETEAFNFEYETLPTGDTLRPYRLHSCSWGHPWYCDQQIMPLIAEAKATFDPARRATLIKQILARQDEQAAALLLFEPLGLDGVSPKVEGYSQESGIIPYARVNVRN